MLKNIVHMSQRQYLSHTATLSVRYKYGSYLKVSQQDVLPNMPDYLQQDECLLVTIVYSNQILKQYYDYMVDSVSDDLGLKRVLDQSIYLL